MARTRIRTSASVERYRRSPALVFYWSGPALVCFDAVRAQRLRVPPDVVTWLALFGDWTSACELRRRVTGLGSAADIERTLRRMSKLGLLEREGQARPWPWAAWSPEAAFFHFGTRGQSYPDDTAAHNAQLRRKARTDPPPPPTKTIVGPRVGLVAPEPLGDLSPVLLARRTWRNFDAAPVTLRDLSTLLQLTWGVQRWGVVKGQGRVALKTSPSGGARHSIEAYVLAVNIEGLGAGAYHYDAARHELVDLKRRLSRRMLARLLAGQDYYGRASAAIVMTSVFARSMWKYQHSRSYRSVLTEAGHLGQTFCLSATAIGLAPFCTMAFHDHAVETILGIDGLTESALYVVGVGTRPKRLTSLPGRIPKR